MKRIVITVAVALPVVMLACRREQTPPAWANFSDEGVAAASRIGRSLQDSVVASKLRQCWGQLQGEGVVAMDLNYRKAGNTWTFDNVRVTKSTLAADQNAAAQRCMEESARGTSFAVEPREALESAASQFIVRLGWTVPLPPEGTQLTTAQLARMSGGSGPGVITVPGCSTCVPREEYPYGLKCVAKKTGSEQDCEEINSNTCAVTPKACLRGGFSGSGGVIMF
jgi:hypothetical protein